MTGQMVLKRAAEVIAERQQTSGEPAKSMAADAARWSLTLGVPITAEQVRGFIRPLGSLP